MNIGAKLKKLREDKGLTQEELAKHINSTKQTIFKYESGIISNIPMDKLTKIASILGVSPAYILGWEEDRLDILKQLRPIKLKKFRMLGEVACGKPIFADEDHETYIDASADINADYCLTARGDSMIGARIKDGDIVFIQEQSIVENGQIAAVVIGDSVTLKRWFYYPEKKKLVLQAENPNYEPLVYVGEELNEIHCLGRAVTFTSNL